MTKSRDITFDIMKGIGILLVITAHFFSWNHPLLDKLITSFHMPMFFIVAGYFSKSFSTWSDAKSQVKKYATRLLPPYVFTRVFILLWAVLMAFTNKEGWEPVINHALSLFWADPHGPVTPWGTLSIGVVWFLVALFVAKCLLLPLSRLKGWAIPISIALAIAAIYIHRVFPHSIWCISLGLTALPFLTIGWWVRSHRIPRWLIIVSIVCWVGAMLYSHLGMYDMEWDCYPLDFIGACGGTYCLYLFSKFLGKSPVLIPRAFAVLGVWSLAIMCFHNLETHCHLGNHVMALFPFVLPVWGQYVFRYLLTIAMAAVSVKLPVIRKVFV